MFNKVVMLYGKVKSNNIYGLEGAIKLVRFCINCWLRRKCGTICVRLRNKNWKRTDILGWFL